MSTEKNKQVVHRFYQAFNTGNVDALDELMAADVIDHNPGPGQAPGIEGFKQLWLLFRGAFPNIKITVDDLIAEGDKVVARAPARGTQQAEFLGIPATGKSVTIAAIEIYQIEEGKIKQVWHLEDLLGLMQQLGALPSPEPTGL